MNQSSPQSSCRVLRFTFTSAFFSIALAIGSLPLFAEDEVKSDDNGSTEDAEVLEGHSYHGDVFNEGPRQSAVLMGGTGDIHFPVTSTHPDVQKFIDQGIGQLHGFWYLEAERSFRHAASLDPDCAIAYWGAAVANLRNTKRSSGFIEEAVKRKENASEREVKYIETFKKYIDAGKPPKKEEEKKVDPKVAEAKRKEDQQKEKDRRKKRTDDYTRALEEIILEYPDDLEAKAFLALHLYSSRGSSSSYFATSALMDEILSVNPLHPVHHFKIHLWDHKKPARALESAALCGQSAPSIAHMWHMPGHIYSRLKRYNDAAWQQEASARVDHAQMMRYQVMPDQIHNFAHNNEWLIRNLIFVGRVDDALSLAKNMTELPRHPKYNSVERRGSAKYGRQRLFQVLQTFEMWSEVIKLADTPYLEPTNSRDEQLKRLRLLGLAYYQTGDSENGDKQLNEVRTRLDAAQAKSDEAVAKAEATAKEKESDKKATEKAVSAAKRPFSSEIRAFQGAVNALKGHQAISKENYQEGYDLLKKAGGVDSLYLTKIQFLSGEEQKAIESLQSTVKSKTNEVKPLALLTSLLWESGKKSEAKKSFEELRKISGTCDIDTPIFAKLATIAKASNYDGDWRVPYVAPKDTGNRPALSDLGPFRWQASKAPEWALAGTNNSFFASSELKGKPHVLIFYLGAGCLHCAEQIQAFAPKMKEYEDAGLAMLAISTDGAEGLQTSVDNYGETPLPIPIYANEKLDIFKDFRCYDDFENQPLHGTFVIDGDGKVLWQDISYEPFMDPDFVLKEAKRLLAQ